MIQLGFAKVASVIAQVEKMHQVNLNLDKDG